MTRLLALCLLTTACAPIARVAVNVACTIPLCSVEYRDRLWVCPDMGRCSVKDYPRTK